MPCAALTALLLLASLLPRAEAVHSVTITSVSRDTYLDQANSTTNYGATTPITVKTSSSANRRVLVRMSGGSLPPSGSAVKSGNLSLYMSTAPTSSRTYGAYRITNSNWTEGTGAAGSGATWNTYNGTNAWTSAGGDFATVTGTSTTGTTNGVRITWNILADVQGWVNGTYSNNGTLIKDQTESSSGYTASFSSKEDATSGNRPQLAVSYLQPVTNLAATAGNGQVTLYWTLPGTSPDYAGALILRKTGSAPTSVPADGTNPTQGTTLADGSLVVKNDATGLTTWTDNNTCCGGGSLTNGTTYYYQAFARDTNSTAGICAASTCYSLASSTIVSTPTSGASGSPTWSYATGAFSMAPPGLDPNDVVIAGSNDAIIRGMSASSAAQVFTYQTQGAIQAQPPVIPAALSATSPQVNVAYVTSGTGGQTPNVYAVNTTTGALLWTSTWNYVNSTTPSQYPAGLQGAASVWLKAVSAQSICGATTDVVFVGSYGGSYNLGNPTTSNGQVYALNGGTTSVTTTAGFGGNCPPLATSVPGGGLLWTFSPSSPGMDYVSSTPYVDYTNMVLWVTSRSNGNTQPSLWKINLLNGTAASGTATWSLGDIDSSPSPNADGSFVYVGTNAGGLKAIRVSDGTVYTCPTATVCTGTNTIIGFPWSVGTSPDTIIFTYGNHVQSVSFNFSTLTFSQNWTVQPSGTPASVSAPVVDGTNTFLYIGASDGKVHQLQVSNGTDSKQVTIVPGTPTVGSPGFDGARIYVGAADGHIYAFTTPF